MSKYLDKRRLLQDLKNTIIETAYFSSPRKKQDVYYYIDTAIELLSSYDEIDFDYYNNKIKLSEYEYDYYFEKNQKELLNLYINIVANCSSYKEIFNNIICKSIEDNNKDLKIPYPEDFDISKSEFYDIFKEFCDYLGKSKDFDNIYKNKEIIKIDTGRGKYSGTLLYNPYNNKRFIALINFKYTFDKLVTLAHEFGHYKDLEDLVNTKSYRKYHNYYFKTTNIEINSCLYTKLFYKFLLEKGYNKELVNDYALFSLYEGLYYVYNTLYDLDKEDIFKKINRTGKGDDIFFTNDLSLMRNMCYGVGEYYSEVLYDDYLKNGFDSKLYRDFRENRLNSMRPSFLNNEDINPDKYSECLNKRKVLLKK